MKRLLILFAVVIATATTAFADRTTRGKLKVANRRSVTTVVGAVNDTVVPSAGMIIVSGFDKPLRSYRESVFITNRSRRRLTGVKLTISYLDADGRLLHRAVQSLSTDIPAGETRQLTFPSWDRQQAFYYELSSKPRRSDGTPFSVAITADAAIFPIVKE